MADSQKTRHKVGFRMTVYLHLETYAKEIKNKTIQWQQQKKKSRHHLKQPKQPPYQVSTNILLAVINLMRRIIPDPFPSKSIKSSHASSHPGNENTLCANFAHWIEVLGIWCMVTALHPNRIQDLICTFHFVSLDMNELQQKTYPGKRKCQPPVTSVIRADWSKL